MPKLRLTNTHESKKLVIWLEPLGEDFWMCPGEAFTVEFDGSDHAEHVIGDAHFDVSWYEDGFIVWTGSRWCPSLRDKAGVELECGHQRPPAADRAWQLPKLMRDGG
ncbi:hypothetical protein [Nocardia sp. bgisy134]|uniref:hypothetical protein n=1 Tax=unclassified Nocardia TaxID=2637762 RepID=UPI003D742F37